MIPAILLTIAFGAGMIAGILLLAIHTAASGPPPAPARPGEGER